MLNDHEIDSLVFSAGLSYIVTPDKPYIHEDINKLIELVVLDCIKVINTWSVEKPCSEGYDTFLVQKLKEKFKLI